jgi:hypothetical protein
MIDSERVEKAAKALLDVLEIVLPKLDSPFVMSLIRGRPYRGPSIRPQMDELRRALASRTVEEAARKAVEAWRSRPGHEPFLYPAMEALERSLGLQNQQTKEKS